MSSTTSLPGATDPSTASATRLLAPGRWTPRGPWPRRILWANLVAQIGIVVTGGAVRLTGSGLGCSTWPQCEPGQFAPVLHEATTLHPYIEFGNRTLTGVLGVLALLTAWTVWRRRDRSRAFRLLGLVPLAGVAVQAVVGGLTVLVDLHPAWVGSHFAISMLLVAASAVLVRRYGEDDGAPVPLVGPGAQLVSRALVPLCAAVVLLGVLTTGSGPHSGDAEVGYRFALDPALIARVHAASVWLFVLGVGALVALTRTTPARRAVLVLLGVTLAQGLVGYVQYFTGLPEVLVALHMLGAGLLVTAQTFAVLAMRRRQAAEPAAPVTPSAVTGA